MHSVASESKVLENPMLFVPKAASLPIREQLVGKKLGNAAWMESAKKYGVDKLQPSLSREWVDKIADLLIECVNNGVISSNQELGKYLKQLNDVKKVSDVANQLASRLNALEAEGLVAIDKSISDDFESEFKEELPPHFILHTEYQSGEESEKGEYALRNYDSTAVFYVPVDTYTQGMQKCLCSFISFVSHAGHLDNTFDWGGYLEIDEMLYEIDEKKLSAIYEEGDSLGSLLESAKKHLKDKEYKEILDFIESFYEVDLKSVKEGDDVPDSETGTIYNDLFQCFGKHVAGHKSKAVFNEKLAFTSCDLPTTIKRLCKDTLAHDKQLTAEEKTALGMMIKLLVIAEKHYVQTEYTFESYSDITHMGYVQSILVLEEFYGIGEEMAQEHENHLMQAGDCVDYTIDIKNDRCLHALRNILLSSYLTQYLTKELKEIRDEHSSNRKRTT